MITTDELMAAVYDTADATGIFANNDIKVRIQSFHHYKLGSNKTNFSKTITARLKKLLPSTSFLSVSISEYEAATYCNSSLINPRNTNHDRHFEL